MSDLDALDLRARARRATRPKRKRTTTIVLHHFGVEPLTLENLVQFFTDDAEGVATVTLGGSYARKLPTIRSWRQRGVPEHRKAQSFVPYHFAIDPDGAVAQYLDLDDVGAHAATVNSRSVAVALLGMFHRAPPSEAQISALFGVLRHLASTYGALELIGHDEANVRGGLSAKGCPGAHVDLETLRAWFAGVAGRRAPT